MGMLVEGFNALVEMERQYGNEPGGSTMLDGVISEVVGILPDPFPLGIFGLELAHTKINALVTGIRAHIKAYLNPVVP